MTSTLYFYKLFDREISDAFNDKLKMQRQYNVTPFIIEGLASIATIQCITGGEPIAIGILSTISDSMLQLRNIKKKNKLY